MKGWTTFGFARCDDYARERLGRSGRWLRDRAAIGSTLEAIPAVAGALTGNDGGRPIGGVAALLIGRIAANESFAAWLSLARSVSLRDLRRAVCGARRAGSAWPLESGEPIESGEPVECGEPEDDPHSNEDDPHSNKEAVADAGGPPAANEADDPDGVGDPDGADRALVRIGLPAPVRAAFDEAVDLFRCLDGGEAPVTSFVEALVAESAAGDFPPDTEAAPMKRGLSRDRIERLLAHCTDQWSHLPDDATTTAASRLAANSAARFAWLDRIAGRGGPADLDRQLRGLLRLEDELAVRLGQLLAEMGDRNAWSRLRFAGTGHYAEERLRIARSTAEDRVRAARVLQRLPIVKRAYEGGAIGLEAALIVARILADGTADRPTQEAWLRRAGSATIKRLRDEARALGRRAVRVSPRVAGVYDVEPLADADWHAANRREAGTARNRVFRYGRLAAGFRDGASSMAVGTGGPDDSTGADANSHSSEMTLLPLSPDVFLRLRLPRDIAMSFLASIESIRRALSREVERIAWDASPGDAVSRHRAGRPSFIAARTFSIRCRRLPAWVGLLALLEDFVDTWDIPRRTSRTDRDAVYIRDGWRCTAPGCTSRRNLEDHHIEYRSRGGNDALSNRTCLCRFHHQLGEHGNLASCRGVAPLTIEWQLGRPEARSRYRNERALPETPGPTLPSRRAPRQGICGAM